MKQFRFWQVGSISGATWEDIKLIVPFLVLGVVCAVVLASPLNAMALGDEMVFYCSSFQIPFNLLLWTHGYSIIKGDKTVNLKKLLANPNLIALYIGITGL
jgi:predicted permease